MEQVVFTFKSLLDQFENESEANPELVAVFARFVGDNCFFLIPEFPLLDSSIRRGLAKSDPNTLDLFSAVAPVYTLTGHRELLPLVFSVLVEQVAKQKSVRLLHAILVGTKESEPDSRTKRELFAVLRNYLDPKDDQLFFLVTKLFVRCASFSSSEVAAEDWLGVVHKLADTLDARNKYINKGVFETISAVADLLGPLEVLPSLLQGLEQKRTHRSPFAVSIAHVGKKCGPFTVLPALLNEFIKPNRETKVGVLKSVRLLFAMSKEESEHYVLSLLPLLEHALTQQDWIFRKEAIATVQTLAENCHNSGLQRVFVHLLNFVWTSLSEEQPELHERVLSCVESITALVGVEKVVLLSVGGLFHPAKTVRTGVSNVLNRLNKEKVCFYLYFNLGETINILV